MIKFTHDIKKLNNCKIIYVSSDILTNERGIANYYIIKKYINLLCQKVKKNRVLVILSQAYPGFTRKINWPKKNLFYQVETLIFGKALERALRPERIIIGCYNKNNINRIYFNFIKKYKCPIIKMKYESAEFAKISINILLSSTVNTTNNLARICEFIKADWSEIKPSLKLDERIGEKAYLDPGLGISGLNLLRDINTAIKLSQNIEDIRYLKNFIDYSNYSRSWAVSKLKDIIRKNKYFNINLCLLGLTYKENTDSTKNSAGIDFLNKMRHCKTKVYDPMVKKIKTSKKIILKKNLHDAIINSDILIILTPWKEFAKISKKFLIKNISKKIIIDPYNVLKSKVDPKIFKHYIIGRE